MGHPLSQTLFTSIYIDRLLWPQPRNLESAQFSPQADEVTPGRPLVNKVLRAFCLGLVKSCSYVLSQIAAQPYYEVSQRIGCCASSSLTNSHYRKRILSRSSTTAIFSQTSLRKISKGKSSKRSFGLSRNLKWKRDIVTHCSTA